MPALVLGPVTAAAGVPVRMSATSPANPGVLLGYRR